MPIDRKNTREHHGFSGVNILFLGFLLGYCFCAAAAEMVRTGTGVGEQGVLAFKGSNIIQIMTQKEAPQCLEEFRIAAYSRFKIVSHLLDEAGDLETKFSEVSKKYATWNPSRQQSILYGFGWVALHYFFNFKCEPNTYSLFLVVSAVSYATWRLEMKAMARECQRITDKLEILKNDIYFLIGHTLSLTEILSLSRQHRDDFLLRKSFIKEELVRVELSSLATASTPAGRFNTL